MSASVKVNNDWNWKIAICNSSRRFVRVFPSILKGWLRCQVYTINRHLMWLPDFQFRLLRCFYQRSQKSCAQWIAVGHQLNFDDITSNILFKTRLKWAFHVNVAVFCSENKEYHCLFRIQNVQTGEFKTISFEIRIVVIQTRSASPQVSLRSMRPLRLDCNGLAYELRLFYIHFMFAPYGCLLREHVPVP